MSKIGDIRLKDFKFGIEFVAQGLRVQGSGFLTSACSIHFKV